MSTKRALYIILPLIVIIGALVAFFELRTSTYTISGTVTDIATKQPLSGAKVAVGKQSVKTSPNGTYKISNLSDSGRITISDTGYVSDSTPLGLTKDMTKNFTLEPTLTSVVDKVDNAFVNQEFSLVWPYVSPNDKAHWGSQSAYTAFMQKKESTLLDQGASIDSLAVHGPPVVIPSWTSSATHQTYKNVTEVPVKITATINGTTQSIIQLDYYKSINGFYHYLVG